jgi:hypothetical protein
MEELPALERALEAAVWCPLRRHRPAAGATAPVSLWRRLACGVLQRPAQGSQDGGPS